MPAPHVSVSAQNDIAHALEWSYENFGDSAEARYAALIAAAIATPLQTANHPDSRGAPSWAATSSVGTSRKASCTAPAE